MLVSNVSVAVSSERVLQAKPDRRQICSMQEPGSLNQQHGKQTKTVFHSFDWDKPERGEATDAVTLVALPNFKSA